MDPDDYANPTPASLRAWARSGDLGEQDFDLMIASSDDVGADDLIGFVEEGLEPQFFLDCLYMHVVHARPDGVDRPPWLAELADRGRRSAHPWIRTWGDRVDALRADPDSFDHADWCDRRLSRRPTG